MVIENLTHAVYGDFWGALSGDERALLIADIREVASEMSADYMAAAREHCRRIGGPTNLRGYVACLVAGEARRKREASK